MYPGLDQPHVLEPDLEQGQASVYRVSLRLMEPQHPRQLPSYLDVSH